MRDLPSGRVLLVALLAGCGFLLALAFMATVPFNGDEQTYVNRSRAIAGLLTGQRESLANVTRQVVGTGWFMPGVSLVLVPLYAIVPEAGVAVVRAYLAGLNLLLWIWAMREVLVALGPRGQAAFVVFPTLSAMWLVFSATAWGDLSAGLLVAIVAARVFRFATALLEHEPIQPRHVVVAELAMAAMVYLRGSTIVVVAVGHLLLLGVAMVAGRSSRLLGQLGVLTAGGALFCLLLAPWSVAASLALGDTVVTTSSASLAIGTTFGDADELCFGPCPPQGVWAGELQFSREYAEQHGISELEAQRRMTSHALSDVSLRDYLAQVRDNFLAFITPTGAGPRRGLPFMDRFVAISDLDIGPQLTAMVTGTVRILTLAGYLPFFAALVIANFLIVVRSQRLQLLSLLVKALTVSLFLQPFLHLSHARYWTAFAPVMTLGAVLLVEWWTTSRGMGARQGQHMPTRIDNPGRILVGLQATYVLAMSLIVLAVTLA